MKHVLKLRKIALAKSHLGLAPGWLYLINWIVPVVRSFSGKPYQPHKMETAIKL